MAAKSVAASNGQQTDQKLSRLPNNYRIQKRPLIHAPVASPYAGRSSEKVVYLSTKMPFMAAVKRVKHLLRQGQTRENQAALEQERRNRRKNVAAVARPSRTQDPEPVLIKASGKAIDKALQLALFLQQQTDLFVTIETGTTDVIDDLVPKHSQSTVFDSILAPPHQGDLDVANGSTADSDEFADLPDSRIRRSSTVEISVVLR